MPVTLTNQTKHTTTLTDVTKNTAVTLSDSTKHTASLTNGSKSGISSLLDTAKASIYLNTENLFHLITEAGDALLTEAVNSIPFTNAAKS